MKNINRINKFNELLKINNCYDNDNYYNIKDQIITFIIENDNIEKNKKIDIEKVFNKLNVDLRLIKKYNLNDELNILIKSLIKINNEIDKFIDINEQSLLYKIYNNKINDNIVNNIIKYKENIIYNYVYYIFSNIMYYSSKLLYENYFLNNITSYYMNHLIINILFHTSSGIYLNIFLKIIFKYIINGYLFDYMISYIEKYKLKCHISDVIKNIDDIYIKIFDINILLEKYIMGIFQSSNLEEYDKNIILYNQLLNNIFINFSYSDYEIIE